jgi:hypothetical protein
MLRRVGFADHDAAGGFHSTDHQAVLGCQYVGRQWRTQTGAKTRSIGQILDGLGHAMHPAHGLIPCQLGISCIGLAEQFILVCEAHQGVAQGVVLGNLLQCHVHDLAA